MMGSFAVQTERPVSPREIETDGRTDGEKQREREKRK